MKWSWFGRAATGVVSAMALGLGMTACGGGTVAYLWTIGTQHNQIVGYKVDNNTGNLTATQGSPYTTNGTAPVYILVKPGGRYVYVINQGTGSTRTSNSPLPDSGIAVFSVGGNGSLTYQDSFQSQGFQHLWASFDGGGNYLYVLDRYSPSGDGNGAVTTFSVDPNTGRLQLVTQTGQTPSGGTAPAYVEVGINPLRFASTGSCLYTVNQGPNPGGIGNIQSITPFGESGGQLNTVTTGSISQTPYIRATSIIANSSTVVVTDAGPTDPTTVALTTHGRIYPYNTTGSCSLTPFTGTGSVANDPSVSNPVNSFLSSNNNLFVLNDSVNTSNPSSPFSQISAYNIVNNQLTPISGQPFTSGSGPVCMAEDPTSKWIYVANRNAGTITGYTFANTQGVLSPLPRGSTFNTGDTGLQCLALSGSVSQ